jgi:hypothetical protein
MENDVRLEEPAILVWLPVGQAPTDNDFVLTEGKQPHCRPQHWHTFSNLLEIFPAWDQGKAPWVKVGQQIFSPNEIRDLVGSHNL